MTFNSSIIIKQRIYCKKQGLFTKYDIKHIAMFKSRYAFMLYEFCKMNLGQITNQNKDGEFSKSFTIQDFKERLDIADKYKRFNQLEEKVLTTAKNNINKHSDIKFSYRIKRKGRTPVAITLIAKYKIDSPMLKPENFELVKEVEAPQNKETTELPMQDKGVAKKWLNEFKKL